MERENGSPRPSPSARILPTLAVLAVASIVALVLFAAAHRLTRGLVGEDVFLKNYREPFWEESILYHKMEYVLHSNEDNDVVILGDSAAWTNVDPERLQADLGISAYNLGTLAWLQTDGHLQILRDYVRNHPKPKLVVYMLILHGLRNDELVNNAFRDRFIWTYGPEMRREKGFVLWPLAFRLREEFRTLIGRAIGRRYQNVEVAPGLTHDAVGKLLARQRGFFGRSAAKRWPIEPIGPLSVSDERMEEFAQLARFCDEQGIRLMLRFAPVPKSAAPPDLGTVSAWLDRFHAQFPDVRIDAPVLLTYPDEWFVDSGHFEESAARRFTDQLAPRVAAALKR